MSFPLGSLKREREREKKRNEIFENIERKENPYIYIYI